LTHFLTRIVERGAKSWGEYLDIRYDYMNERENGIITMSFATCNVQLVASIREVGNTHCLKTLMERYQDGRP
jgi:hypothetical protein